MQGGRGHREEEEGTTEAEGAIKLSTKSNVKISNALFAIRRDTHKKVAQSKKITLKTHLVHLGPSKQKL